MDAAPPSRWVRHSVAGLARTVLAVVAGLVIWTILPAILGWHPTVVLSGSMEPAIRAGDVVLTREMPPEELRPGHVLLVENPDRPDHLLLHRYDHADDDGSLVLRGDANRQADSTAIAPDQVHGVGILRVPYVGLPHTWVASGEYAPVGLTALALLALAALSPIRERPSPHAGTLEDDADAVTVAGEMPSPEDSPRPRARHAAVAGAALSLVLVAGAHNLPVTAEAAFTDRVTATATFSAGTWEAADPVPAAASDSTTVDGTPAED